MGLLIRICSPAACFVVFLTAVCSPVAAAVPIVFPQTPITVLEGDDFATEILQNAWDFEQSADFGLTLATSAIIVGGGTLSGSELADPPNFLVANLLALRPGLAADPLARVLPGDFTLPKSGRQFPIPAGRFSYLSMKFSHSDRSNIKIRYRYDDQIPLPGSPECMKQDGDQLGAVFLPNDNGTFVSYFSQLTDNPIDPQRDGFLCSTPWNGLPQSFDIIPSDTATFPPRTWQFDWIRLVDPTPTTQQPLYTVSWSNSNPVGPNGLAMEVYYSLGICDTVNGILMHRQPALSNLTESYSFPTAALPPGEYYFYVAYVDATGIPFRFKSTACTGPLTVKAKPRAWFNSPSETSGPDYAVVERGDAWDMSQATDILNTTPSAFPQNFTNDMIPFLSGLDDVFKATSIGGVYPQGTFPPMALLSTNPLVPIDPRLYRYLTFRSKVNLPTAVADANRGGNGFLSGFGFGNGGLLAPIDFYSDLNLIFDNGVHDYAYDLWDPNSSISTDWLGSANISRVGISPLRALSDTDFEIHDVKLSMNNTPNALGNFNLAFTIEDDDFGSLIDPVTVKLFYDDDSFSFTGTQIGADRVFPQPEGSFAVAWDTSGLPDGTYFVYAEVFDNDMNKTRVYASTPVLKGPIAAPNPGRPSPYDYDPDNKSDQTVFRPLNGKSFQNRSGSQSVSVTWVQGPQFFPCTGDFDGDNKADLCMVFEWYGYLGWYRHYSQNDTVSGDLWGFATDQFAIGDYNGDNRDDIGVFRDGQWWILYTGGGAQLLMWGQPGDIPVPADYDEDNKDDLAVWRPADGTWWILNSGFGQVGSIATNYFDAIQFGLPGDTPLTLDFSGDQIVDLAVVRTMGPWKFWFLRDRIANSNQMVQWGLDGDVPVIGDYNKDGKSDLTVVRPPGFVWFHNFLNGSSSAVQYGLPGDRIPGTFKSLGVLR